jgi:hypothetical protein
MISSLRTTIGFPPSTTAPIASSGCNLGSDWHATARQGERLCLS